MFYKTAYGPIFKLGGGFILNQISVVVTAFFNYTFTECLKHFILQPANRF